MVKNAVGWETRELIAVCCCGGLQKVSLVLLWSVVALEPVLDEDWFLVRLI